MALPNFSFGDRGIFPFIKAFQYLRIGYVSNIYPNGAVKPPVDYSIDNNCPIYADRADGATAIQVGIPADANNITQITNPHGIAAMGLSVAALATPAAPTVAPFGAAGVTTYTYAVVAKSGQGNMLGFSPASATGSTTTGNATLSVTNYNQITITAVVGAKSYDVYRTVGGATQGRIGTVSTLLNSLGTVQNSVIGSGLPLSVSRAGNGTSSVIGTLLFNDTGLVADGTTAPTTNSTGIIQGAIFGDITVVQLATPVNVVATPQGVAGSTTITYKIVAKSASGVTAASSAGTTTTANATLTAANSVLVTWNPVPSALSYDVYRTAAGGTPSTTGKIGNVLSVSEGTLVSFTDTGIAGDSSTAPTANTTGGIVIPGTVNAASLAPVFVDSAATGTGVISAANMINGLIRCTSGGPFTLTTDTAANIVAAIPNCVVGQTFETDLFNGSGGIVTLALGSGVTAITPAGTLTTASVNVHTFYFRVTNVGTPAIQIYSLGASAY